MDLSQRAASFSTHSVTCMARRLKAELAGFAPVESTLTVTIGVELTSLEDSRAVAIVITDPSPLPGGVSGSLTTR